MPTFDEIRRMMYGRTRSEQVRNARAEADLISRGKGRSAARGTDGIAREQIAADRLWELGYDRPQKVETHAGKIITFHPIQRSRAFDRTFPGFKYRPVPIDQPEIRELVRLALRRE